MYYTFSDITDIININHYEFSTWNITLYLNGFYLAINHLKDVIRCNLIFL